MTSSHEDHPAMHPLSICIMLWLVVICLFSPAVLGLPVTGLYSHVIAVENQSEQERDRAFGEALEAVITKVTGEQRWLENPRIQQALDNARNFVEAIEYRTERIEQDVVAVESVSDPVSGEAPPPVFVEQELLNVSFARDLIDSLLAEAAIPVWDSNRPSVLVWMVLQNDAGERQLLSEESSPQIIQLMREFAAQRGIPIIFPVLDFEDRRTLSPDLLWALDEVAVVSASARYAPDSILAGRLHFTAGGELVGLWQFIFQDQVQVFDSLETELASYIRGPLDQVTTQLARHFSVLPTRGGQGTAKLRIEGVDNLSAYADLVNYLQELVLVESVTVSSINGPVLEFDLALQGSQDQLAELLSLDRNLSPLEPGGLEDRQALRYRWAR